MHTAHEPTMREPEPAPDWPTVTTAIRAHDLKVTPIHIEVFVPYPESPLAVSNVHNWDYAEKKWTPAPGAWRIMHRPTGFHLGKADESFESFDDAMTVLRACRPEFPGWLMCTGKNDDPATVACRMWFRLALEAFDNAAA